MAGPPPAWPSVTERRTLIACASCAALLCLMPREWVSAGALGVITAGLVAVEVVMTRREARAPKRAVESGEARPGEATGRAGADR